MTNPLNRFHLSSRSRSSEIKYVDYTSKITPLGDFDRIENIDVIINSWNNILLTPRGTYDHDPQYGSGLYDLIFEPASVETEEKIHNEIYSSLYLYDDRAKIEKIKIQFAKNQKGYKVEINVNYSGEIRLLNLFFRGVE